MSTIFSTSKLFKRLEARIEIFKMKSKRKRHHKLSRRLNQLSSNNFRKDINLF